MPQTASTAARGAPAGARVRIAAAPCCHDARRRAWPGSVAARARCAGPTCCSASVAWRPLGTGAGWSAAAALPPPNCAGCTRCGCRDRGHDAAGRRAVGAAVRARRAPAPRGALALPGHAAVRARLPVRLALLRALPPRWPQWAAARCRRARRARMAIANPTVGGAGAGRGRGLPMDARPSTPAWSNCRAPLAFVLTGWRRGAWGAFRMGVDARPLLHRLLLAADGAAARRRRH